MRIRVFLAVLLMVGILSACSEKRGIDSSDSEIVISVPSDKLQEDGDAQKLEKDLEVVNTQYLPILGNLINCGDWNSAEEIPVTMYYDWYRDYINSVTTPEERIERYKIDQNPEVSGWAYPAEEFENYIRQYFDVSIEYLRTHDEVYQPDKKIYYIPGGGSNISYRTKVESEEDIQIKDDQMIIRVSCSLIGDFSDTIYKKLTMDISGGSIKFISCLVL